MGTLLKAALLLAAVAGAPVGYVFYQAALCQMTGFIKGAGRAIGVTVEFTAHRVQLRVLGFPSSQSASEDFGSIGGTAGARLMFHKL